jgi:DNA-directed RNA polymerase specialized sigma24 family protein
MRGCAYSDAAGVSPERSDRALKHEPAEPEPDTTDAPLGWLASFAGDQEARRIAEIEQRLRADADLVGRLMFAGYRGADWDEVAGRLAAYGVRILTAWIIDGTIATKCREKNWAGPWNQRCQNFEVARDLATDTVAEALAKFRDQVLIPGRWDPKRGASLSTYYIGQCLLRWANVYHRWARGRKNEWPVSTARTETSDLGAPDPSSAALDKVEIAANLAGADDLTTRTILYRAADFSWEEIAALTGEPVSTLRGRLYRFQQVAAAHREAS